MIWYIYDFRQSDYVLTLIPKPIGVIHWYFDIQPMEVIHWYFDTQSQGYSVTIVI